MIQRSHDRVPAGAGFGAAVGVDPARGEIDPIAAAAAVVVVSFDDLRRQRRQQRRQGRRGLGEGRYWRRLAAAPY